MPNLPPAPQILKSQQQENEQKHVTSTSTSTQPPSSRNDDGNKSKDIHQGKGTTTTATKITTASPSEQLHLSDTAKTKLISEHAIQDNITDELLGLTEALKTNTLAMEGKLKERGQLLDTAEEALDKSVAGAKVSAAKATALHKQGRINICLTCLIMLIIGCLFAGMFMFIRVTRFAGYKRASVVIQNQDTAHDNCSIHAEQQQTITGMDDTYYYEDEDEATKQEL